MDLIIKEENKWELVEAIQTIIRIGIKSGLIDGQDLINYIYSLE